MDQPIPHRPARRPTAPKAIEPLEISFGVEFEFILIQSFPDWEEWVRKKPEEKVFYGLSQVGNVLKNTWFRCKSCRGRFQMPIGVQTADGDWRSDHNRWNVVADASMVLTERQKRTLWDGNCGVLAVEVTSRKLFADRDVPVPVAAGSTTTTTTTTMEDHQHTISTAEEIKTVLAALNLAFNSPAAAAKDGPGPPRWVVVNKTCDLHVHVGNDENGFPLQTVKNLLSLCTAFERLIDSMHPHTRTGGTALALAALDALDSQIGTGGLLDGGYAVKKLPLTQHRVPNVPLTEHFIARAWSQRRDAHHRRPASAPSSSTPSSKPVAYPFTRTPSDLRLAQAVSGLHTAAFVDIIQGAPDLDPLIDLVLGKKTTVNVMYLLEWRYAAKTIEFRQHAAATSPAETLPWIDFVTALVRYAHESSAETIRAACRHAASNARHSLMGFLVELDMQSVHMDYYIDRVHGSESFSDHVAARAEVEAAFGDDDDGPLKKIALELIEERNAEYDHATVGKAVRDKFDAGGYGQFSRQFIDEYAPDLENGEKVKLTIGWEAPVTGPEDEYVFPPLPKIEGVEDIDILD